MEDALNYLLNALDEDIKGITEEFEDFEHEQDEFFNSTDPDSIRMMTLEDILYSADAYELGINLIARNQLWENQVNRYNQPLPLYKPRTIRYKIQRGVPAEKRVRYTEFDKGAFYNEGIQIEVNRATDFFDFFITDRRDYFAYIPDDVVGLTPENEDIFKYQIGEWLNERLMDYWLRNNV